MHKEDSEYSIILKSTSETPIIRAGFANIFLVYIVAALLLSISSITDSHTFYAGTILFFTFFLWTTIRYTTQIVRIEFKSDYVEMTLPLIKKKFYWRDILYIVIRDPQNQYGGGITIKLKNHRYQPSYIFHGSNAGTPANSYIRIRDGFGIYLESKQIKKSIWNKNLFGKK